MILLGNKNFYKANLHCHTTNSDGTLTPNRIKEEYKKRGYSVVAFTDHEHIIDNSYLSDEEFLAINGCEIAIKEFPKESTLKNYNMKVVHLNFYAKTPQNTVTPCYNSVYDHFLNDDIVGLVKKDGEFKREFSEKGINKIIKTANEKGFLVSFNHPSWSLASEADFIGFKNLFAIEIYNYSSTIEGFSDDEKAFDRMINIGENVFCVACDDNHNRFSLNGAYNDSFGAWVNISAESLNYESIISALERGEFYASTGPSIKFLERKGREITIETSPAKKISLITRGRRTESVLAEENEYLTCVKLSLKDTDGYFRIKVTDEKGKCAYTNKFDI